MAFDEKGQADTKERKVEICARAYDILVNQVGFPAEDIIFDPNIFAVATGIEEHNNYGVDFIEATREIKAALPARQDLRRRLEPLLRLPRQRAGAQGDALGVPLPRHPGRHGHGHRQCGPARGLRPDPAGAARRLRGRDPQPQPRGDRAAARAGAQVQGHRRGRRDAGRRMAQLAGREAAGACAGQGHGPVRRRRHRGGAPADRPADRGHRGPADGRHERGRRSVRRRQDVPAAGGEERARDEEGGRAPAALHRGGEDRDVAAQGQDRHGDGQGRRPRHRQEHRRRGPAVQQFRGHRSRRHGAVPGHPEVGQRQQGRHDRPLGPDHAVARRDGDGGRGDDAPGLQAAAADRRRHDLEGPHRAPHRAALQRHDRARARRLARGRRLHGAGLGIGRAGRRLRRQGRRRVRGDPGRARRRHARRRSSRSQLARANAFKIDWSAYTPPKPARHGHARLRRVSAARAGRAHRLDAVLPRLGAGRQLSGDPRGQGGGRQRAQALRRRAQDARPHRAREVADGQGRGRLLAVPARRRRRRAVRGRHAQPRRSRGSTSCASRSRSARRAPTCAWPTSSRPRPTGSAASP